MELTRQAPAAHPLIQRYGNGGFRVSGEMFSGSILVLPKKTVLWSAAAFAALTVADFAPLVAMVAELDVCLLGCGEHMTPLPAALKAALKESGLTIDPMSTAAACRTYNVLAGEGRAVAAAIIAI